MRVRVLFFGVLKDLTGKTSDTFEIREGASVEDVLTECRRRSPNLQNALSSIAVAVNQHYAGCEVKLKSGDEIALLPPVSGGSADANRQDSSTPGASGSSVSTHASIVRQPIDTEGKVSNLKRGEDGAVLIFEGVVRNHTRGRRALYLDYEAFEPMALSEMESLATEAIGKFAIRDVALEHRLGRLQIGETSVLVAVVSAHRAAAFEACRWLIDTLKRKVPIWKKEYFEDGAVWADGEPFPAEITVANSSPAGSPTERPASK